MVQEIVGKNPPGIKDVHPGKSADEVYQDYAREIPAKSETDLLIDFYLTSVTDVIQTKNPKAVAFFLTNVSNEYKSTTTNANKNKLNEIFKMANDVSSAGGVASENQNVVQAVSKQYSKKVLELN